MAKATTSKNGSPSQKDYKADWKQRVYCDPVLWVTFRNAAEALGKSPSALLTKEIKAALRKRSAKLRQLGVKLPEVVFTK